MKKILFALSLSVLVTTIAAQEKPKRGKGRKGNKITTAATPQTMSKETNYDFIVSFISIGAGIDHKTREKLDNFLETNKKKPVLDKIQRGREGETEYCFRFPEFSTNERKTFIEEVKKVVGTTDLVKFSENQSRVKN
ncbi:MAG: hypothetical protein ACJ76F_13185 [Bacteroidia bacterium]